MAKIKITQAKSPIGNEYIIYQFKDAHNLPSVEIYKLASNCKEVAEEFGISEYENGRNSKLNTREMCVKMVAKINKENLHSDLK